MNKEIKKLTFDDYCKLRSLVYRGARPLEFTLWRCAFENGDPEDVVAVISCYQNEDGGFGHALEANCWNPNSSPYVTSLAIGIIGGLYGLNYAFSDRNHPVLRGILKYLASGDYATETGWLGMAGVPANNEHSHAPWFHYDPANKSDETDPETIVAFVLKYGEKDSALYKKAVEIKRALPKTKPVLDFSNFNPATAAPWEPMPTDIADSPESPFYPEYKELVEAELNGIVDFLHTIQELPVPGVNGLGNFDDLSWLDNRQIISCYPSTCGFFIMQIELLKRFDRLDFTL